MLAFFHHGGAVGRRDDGGRGREATEAATAPAVEGRLSPGLTRFWEPMLITRIWKSHGPQSPLSSRQALYLRG